MTQAKIAATPVAREVADILDSPEVAGLIRDLDALRWTGRKGYGARALVGACLVKSLYAIDTWTRTAALIADHAALRDALGAAPSEWACYRFTKRLRQERQHEVFDACIARVIASLHAEQPEFGERVAIDASDLPGYANGQRFLRQNGPERERYSDPDATWGHRSAVSTRKGGGFYGYKIHAAVCIRTGLLLGWEITTARRHESSQAMAMIQFVADRNLGTKSIAMDKGYDQNTIYDSVMDMGAVPIIPIRNTIDVRRGEDAAPSCKHGEWVFAGADYKNRRGKWRCPTGECTPKSLWRAASRRHPLIPRETKRWGELYAGRSAVERTFGRLKHNYGLTPLRVRGLEQVALHTDLCALAQLSQALSRARRRAVPLAA